MFQTRLQSPLLSTGNSLWRAIEFCLNFKLFWVIFPSRLGYPDAFIGESLDDDHIVGEHILGHPHPVDLDVRREVLQSPDGVIVDRPIMGR